MERKKKIMTAPTLGIAEAARAFLRSMLDRSGWSRKGVWQEFGINAEELMSEQEFQELCDWIFVDERYWDANDGVRDAGLHLENVRAKVKENMESLARRSGPEHDPIGDWGDKPLVDEQPVNAPKRQEKKKERHVLLVRWHDETKNTPRHWSVQPSNGALKTFDADDNHGPGDPREHLAANIPWIVHRVFERDMHCESEMFGDTLIVKCWD